MGFSPIYIGVNRTSDKTLEIINKISQTEKQVKAYCIDWIDQTGPGLNTRIQNIGYAYLTNKIDKTIIDYVAFLDIDEFWFNIDKKKVQDYIQEQKPFDIASFYWLCQQAEEVPFAPPFKNVSYKKSNIVKSIISTHIINQVNVFTYHVPIFKQENYLKLRHIDQYGNNISTLNAKKTITHRHQRLIIQQSQPAFCTECCDQKKSIYPWY